MCKWTNGTQVMGFCRFLRRELHIEYPLRGSSAFVQAWELRRLSSARWLRPSGPAHVDMAQNVTYSVCPLVSYSYTSEPWPSGSRRSLPFWSIGDMIGAPNAQAHFTPTMCWWFQGSSNQIYDIIHIYICVSQYGMTYMIYIDNWWCFIFL
jgi:hypothetical protein